MSPEIDYAIDSRGRTAESANEDYLWIGPEDGVNAVLVMDGTSGTAGDFGAKEGKTGGQVYVETFGRAVAEALGEDASRPLEEVFESAITTAWDEFETEAQESVEAYFDGEDVVVQRAGTVPAAVGALLRWDNEDVELLHVGDVVTYVERAGEVERFANEVHEEFDKVTDEYIDEYGRDSEEVREIKRTHRAAHNLPGTYPNMSFNPLVVEKLGVKANYPLREVETVLLSTDGATPRFRQLLAHNNDAAVLRFIDEHGAETTLQQLREAERKSELNTVRSSDDAAMVLLNF